MRDNRYQTMQRTAKCEVIRKSDHPRDDHMLTVSTTLVPRERLSTLLSWMQLPGMFFNSSKCFPLTNSCIDGLVVRGKSITGRPRIAIKTSPGHRVSGKPSIDLPKTCKTTQKHQKPNSSARRLRVPAIRRTACTQCPP